MDTRMHGGGGRRSLWKGPALTTALITAIPVLGNRFVDGWNWNFGAFVVVAVLVFGIGVTYELVTRNVDTIAYRAAVGVALVAPFLLIWTNFVQAADDVNPVAMMYLVVPIVAIIAVAIARFRQDGMARALFATALAQGLVLAIVFMRNPPVTSWTSAVWRGFGGNAFFLVLFIGSALLFRRAAREEPAAGAA